MRLFGYEILFGKKRIQQFDDAWPKGVSRRRNVEGMEPGNQTSVFLQMAVANLNKPTLDYQNSISRDDFLEPEWDLAEIGRYATGESYFLRSVRIKTALMLKGDFSFVGMNQKTISYIQYRLKQISYSTRVPFELLMWRTISDLIQYSNAYWVKIRGDDKRKVQGTRSIHVPGRANPRGPVIGYFYLPPETVTILKPQGKNPLRYQQTIDDEEKTWNAEDIIHFSYDKRGGFLTGMPQAYPALSDIKLLRKLEENVATMIHKHLFPLFHYIVGTDTAPANKDMRTGKDEVDIVRDAINLMPAEGSWVTDHRHKIEVLGAENKALRIEGYLKYFKERVFGGLAISGIDVGELSTANKATASVASRAMVDNVKDYQKVFSWQFNFEVLNELLAESSLAGSGLDVLDDANIVRIKWPEIDKETQIAWENHVSQLWMMNGISHEEYRKEMGREPMTDEEFKQASFLYKVQKLQLEWAAKAKQSAQDTNSSSSNLAASKTTSPNQHGTRIGPKKFGDKEDVQHALVTNALLEMYSSVDPVDWPKISNKIYSIADAYSTSFIDKYSQMDSLGITDNEQVDYLWHETTKSFTKTLGE